jgi:hypothetical protein
MLTIRIDHDLTLRSPTLDDAKALFNIVEINRAHLAEFLP